MTILHISDTHSQHHSLPPLPKADMIVHSGDFTFAGSEDEAYDFMNWFCDLPYRHKIFISGNHDMCMYGVEKIEGLPDDVHYLNNSSVVIDGVKFYGIPLFMEDMMNGKLEKDIQNIPCDTDVLITHQPPMNHCDLADYGKDLTHRGNPMLTAKIEDLHLCCHLFGHEHDAYNMEEYNGMIFSNASIMDNAYNMINAPRIIIV